MSRSYRIGFENMARSAKSSENAERRRVQERNPPAYEECAGLPPSYTEAVEEYYSNPREVPELLLNDDNAAAGRGEERGLLLRLGPESVPLGCPHCRANVLTLVVRVPVSSMNLGKFLVYMLCCCCMPFCCDCSGRQMKKHYCPKCYNLIGVYKHSQR